MGSSWTRDQTHVPCIGRQILIYCTTREVLALFLTIPRESLRLAGLWPHHPERARSCLMLEAKQGRAWLVLGWETGWRQREPKEDWAVPRIAEVILFPVFNLSAFASQNLASLLNTRECCQLQFGTCQEDCQQLNQGICHLPLGRMSPMVPAAVNSPQREFRVDWGTLLQGIWWNRSCQELISWSKPLHLFISRKSLNGDTSSSRLAENLL